METRGAKNKTTTPTSRPTPIWPNVSAHVAGHDTQQMDIADVIRNELTLAINSEEFSRNLIKVILPAITEAIKEEICGEIHAAFQLELSKKQQQLDDATKEIDMLQKKVTLLESKVDDQEQYTRRNCLRIYGVTESEAESTDEVILKLAQEKLKVDMKKEDIDRSHRVPYRDTDNGKPKPIIVKFTSYNLRDKIYRARSLLKGTRIYINEDLTATKQRLYASVRRHPNVTRHWTLDGRIYVITKDEKKQQIRTNDELQCL